MLYYSRSTHSPLAAALETLYIETTTRTLWLLITRRRMSRYIESIKLDCIHSDVVNCMAFSPGGEMLATGSSDGAVVLWSTATGHALHMIRGNSAVLSLCWNEVNNSELYIGYASGLLVNVSIAPVRRLAFTMYYTNVSNSCQNSLRSRGYLLHSGPIEHILLMSNSSTRTFLATASFREIRSWHVSHDTGELVARISCIRR